MTALGEVEYPQYPFPETVPNYDDMTNSRGTFFRQPMVHEDPYTSSGSSGYGNSAPSGYGPEHYPENPEHPTGPSSSGYAVPTQHAPHPTQPSFFGIKKGGSSAMSALTLLSFFFFINLLQTCLKEHMSTLNPTIMVMTSGVLKNRNSKLAEMNSRESTSTSPASAEQIVIKPDVINAVTVTPPPAIIAATLTVVQHNTPATSENVQILNTNHAVHTYPTPATVERPNLNSYDSNYNYPNRTEMPSSTYTHSDRYRPQYDYNDRYHSPYPEDSYKWPKRHHSRYEHGPGSSYSYWDRYENRDFPNHDLYDDTSYLRIY